MGGEGRGEHTPLLAATLGQRERGEEVSTETRNFSGKVKR